MSLPQLFQTIGESLRERLEGLMLNPSLILEINSRPIDPKLSEKYPTAQIMTLPILKQEQRIDMAQIQDESIELILSNLALPWCSPIEPVFLEFVRVLKPEGTLLFSTFGPDTLKELRQSSSLKTHQFIDMHDLGDLLLQVGLSHPVVDAEWFEYHVQELKELLRELQTYQAYPIELTSKSQLKTLCMAYEHYRSAEGGLPVSVEVIYGYATGKKRGGRFKP